MGTKSCMGGKKLKDVHVHTLCMYLYIKNLYNKHASKSKKEGNLNSILIYLLSIFSLNILL